MRALGYCTKREREREQEVLGRINHLLSFHTIWTAQKTILYCCRNMFTELLPSNDSLIHRLSCNKTWTAQKMMHPTILLLLHVFIAMGLCLPSSWIATIGRIQTQRLTGGIYEVCHWGRLRCHIFRNMLKYVFTPGPGVYSASNRNEYRKR
jgi:hypothetical protein